MAAERMRALWLATALASVMVIGACADELQVARASSSPSARPAASRAAVSPAPPPVITFDPPHDTSQAPRFVAGRWLSSLPLLDVQFVLTPEPTFRCAVTVDPDRRGGGYACDGLLPPGTDLRLELTGTTAEGARARATRNVRTMGDRLSAVPWFTEFEDPNGEALGCAAASVRIIQAFTTGRDIQTARQILTRGRPLNKSADPGIDPAAIAAVITALEPTNRYHYYRFATKETATRAAVYWLLRSAKPVIALSLAGQHAPVITGYAGTIGPRYADPAQLTGLVIEDPQRGDLDPATARHRPDKSRSAGFQTGKLVSLAEWYADDWWFRDAYQGSIVFNSDAKLHDIERSDNVYPKPHWAGRFVILVDDGDDATPTDREGQVKPE